MSASNALLQIGELAQRAGVSHRTIHYYERIGLLRPAEREGVGYRYYDEQAVQRLEKIAALKNLGLSLDEIGQVIELYFEDPSGIKGKEQVLKLLETQLQATRSKLGDLRSFERDLESNIARMKGLIEAARKQV
ncbi:DNA-binding transcriptional MerR regulator [Kerstersia gyiorum]|uniref:DNA-binding transcriptional MerR regulator n=1 Tax=Kerstersia gyiorum TaxID=206506 RepID=A0A4Q7MDS8_9BURK|nr:MerR family transcriptional regulator [Kerstersia gyiorum]KAB0542150.1 MerR family transcriptional regulator [Kerstersia gyiorum]RZS64882.1 DNA-binding transcriptional MerR regulator [Kerstersia gyiorum]